MDDVIIFDARNQSVWAFFSFLIARSDFLYIFSMV